MAVKAPKQIIEQPSIISDLIAKYTPDTEIIELDFDGILLPFRNIVDDELLSIKKEAAGFAAMFAGERRRTIPGKWKDLAPHNPETAAFAFWLAAVCEHPELKDKPEHFLALAKRCYVAFSSMVDQLNARSVKRQAEVEVEAITQAGEG